MSDHPISTNYLDKQVARVAAALGGQVYDAAPLELVCAGFNMMMLFIRYTRGQAGGDLWFIVEQSNDPVGADWYQVAAVGQAVVAANADNLDLIQRSVRSYGATAAGAEYFVYVLYLDEGVERVRIPCADSAAQGPGSAAIEAVFTMGG